MKLWMVRLSICAALALSTTCGSSTPTTPTPTTTRIISVSGNLAFGNVNTGQTVAATLTVSNSGNATLTVTGITAQGGTGAAATTATPNMGSISAGGSLVVTIQFTPTIAQFYSTVIAVTSDATSGNNAINFSGSGVGINLTTPFTMSGVGNTVFTLPQAGVMLHITGTYTGSASNFIVQVANAGIICGIAPDVGCQLLVNDLLGTAFGKTVSDGVYQTGGGVSLQIVDSTGVAWTVTTVSGVQPQPNPPVINSFSVDRSTIVIGESVTLQWSVSNATSVSIDNGVGTVSPTGQQTITPPLGSTNYTLTASNSGGSVSRSVSVSATSNSCAASAVPAGTTAICKDGSYSQSQHRSGTCSSHDGVRCWICPGTLCGGLPVAAAIVPATKQCPSAPPAVSRR